MKNKLTILLLGFMAFSNAMFLSAQTKVGFIYVGPVGDLGWTYRHHEGLKAIEKNVYNVSTTHIENVAEGPAALNAITDLAETGHDIIFTTSFGFMDQTNQVAKSYPNIKFEHATGFKRESENMATFSARFYEGRVIQGLIAAKMTKTNKIGYIASFPIPEVIRGINAFMLEAKKHNPDIDVEISWVFTWFDPAKEAAAAAALIDNGADIIVQHTDSPAAMQIAESRGVYAFGQASDMSRFGPKAHLVSIVDNWNSYYVDRVKSLQRGDWTGGDTWWGLSKNGKGDAIGMVEMGSYNKQALGESLYNEAKALEQALYNGDRHSFPCEGILKQDGSEPDECSKGAEHLVDFPTLVKMDWYIKDINAEIPK